MIKINKYTYTYKNTYMFLVITEIKSLITVI